MTPKKRHQVKDIDEVLESLSHGETLTKVIAVDSATTFTAEIHALVKENGTLIVISEKITPKQSHKDKRDG